MSKILLVEPDAKLAELYSVALSRSGYEVNLAASAQSAIIAADKRPPDLIILELQLPAHNGVEFLYELRSYPEWQNTPIIINSFVPIAEFKDNQTFWRQIKISEYLYKPQANLGKLLKSVENSLVQKSAIKS